MIWKESQSINNLILRFSCEVSIWRPRRIVWTRDTFYVSRPGETTALDVLPLHEIQAVIETNDEPESTVKNLHGLGGASGVISKPNSFAEKKAITSLKNCEQSADEGDASIFSQKASNRSILQIKTAVDSCIAGRTYYLSTRNDHHPEQKRHSIVSSLGDAVVVAQRKAIALSRFQKTQEKLRWVQGSFAFQITMAVLIMLVSASTEAAH